MRPHVSRSCLFALRTWGMIGKISPSTALPQGLSRTPGNALHARIRDTRRKTSAAFAPLSAGARTFKPASIPRPSASRDPAPAPVPADLRDAAPPRAANTQFACVSPANVCVPRPRARTGRPMRHPPRPQASRTQTRACTRQMTCGSRPAPARACVSPATRTRPSASAPARPPAPGKLQDAPRPRGPPARPRARAPTAPSDKSLGRRPS